VCRTFVPNWPLNQVTDVESADRNPLTPLSKANFNETRSCLVVARHGLDGSGFETRWRQRLSFIHTPWFGPWGSPSGYWGLFPGIKWPRLGQYSCMGTPPLRLHGMLRGNLYLIGNNGQVVELNSASSCVCIVTSTQVTAVETRRLYYKMRIHLSIRK